MSRSIAVISSLFLLNLAGCQSCWLTEPYACRVDRISDHEHHYEALYSPRWDLNRIGRSDWCSYRHLICRSACERCKPVPCGYRVIAETGRVIHSPLSQQEWYEGSPPAEPTESDPADGLQRETEDLMLPAPPAPATDDRQE